MRLKRFTGPYLCTTAILSCLPFPSILAAQVSVLVDDQDPGVLYQGSPATPWNIGQTCVACSATIDPKQTYDGTWSDATFRDDGDVPQSATYNFTGTAIFVYGVQVQLSTRRPADVLFSIDGVMQAPYTFQPSSQNDTFKYNQPLFAKQDLSNSPHTLVLQNGRVGGGPSLVLVDYLVYMSNMSSSSDPITNGSATSISTVTVTFTPTSLASGPVPSGLPGTENRAPSGLSGSALIAVICLAGGLGATLISIAVWKLHRQLRKTAHDGGSKSDSLHTSPYSPQIYPFVQHDTSTLLPVSAQGVLGQSLGTGNIGFQGSRVVQRVSTDYSDSVEGSRITAPPEYRSRVHG
ncbi:hypothetical protein PsYK624_054230 [Phanerochaete sordida]|uniref:Uncharacterized protein n=1 Tax=Phanerochaete sordida TaxID=48140 RepID=A0A9P3G7M7_9APHY|nr:hypothetical protein PsYK624_054230 [Phanerochaete sordida]